MALINCRECAAEVSSEAVTCPKCGINGPALSAKEASVKAFQAKSKAIGKGMQQVGAVLTLLALGSCAMLMLINR